MPHPSKTVNPLPPIQVRLFAMADRGMAMGHVDGKVAFVPFAAPGDLVEVEVVRRKRRYLQTRLLRVLEPSPRRRPAPCPHFTVCGGCQWQHLSYADQLAGKAASYQGFLRSRLGLRDKRLFRDPLAAPDEWGYRNRVGLKIRDPGDGPVPGFFAAGSHRLVPVAHCPVAHPRINEFLPPLTTFLKSWPPAYGKLPQVDVQVDDRGDLWSVFHVLRDPSRPQRAELGAFLAAAGVRGGWLQGGRKHTLERLAKDQANQLAFRVTAAGRNLPLSISPGGFVQANSAVNQQLVTEVSSLAARYRDATALDLYCGAGNFTLPLAQAAAQVIAVEGYPPAARDAADNAARAGFDQVRVLALPVLQGLRQLAAEGCRPRFALLDPPRDGAADSMEALAHLAPEHILYVSCAPATLARDLKLLCAHGYRVEWTRLADMFPQTAHTESITLLTGDSHP